MISLNILVHGYFQNEFKWFFVFLSPTVFALGFIFLPGYFIDLYPSPATNENQHVCGMYVLPMVFLHVFILGPVVFFIQVLLNHIIIRSGMRKEDETCNNSNVLDV
ncbi:MAG TPA: hypothetical protein VK177_12130 [Flavobacteriales bacterium]|nr:hypothetical protein [Flavobacteriales bacterium]